MSDCITLLVSALAISQSLRSFEMTMPGGKFSLSAMTISGGAFLCIPQCRGAEHRDK